MNKPLTENTIEAFALEELQRQGWQYAYGPDLAPDSDQPERFAWHDVVLAKRLQAAVDRLNPDIPQAARTEAVHKSQRILSPDLLHNNEEFHHFMVEGVKIPYQQDGYERSHEVMLIDFKHPENNEFVAVNQFTVIESGHNKRPDIVLFVNGLPLVVVELKNAADENATTKKAYDQIQTYKAIIPGLFTYNAVCVISDGHEASRFSPQLETLIKGMLNKQTLLDLVRNFIVFEKTKKEDAKTGLTQIVTEKKLAAYHQYYAVNKALQSTFSASGFALSPLGRAGEGRGDKKGGVVWHTQGSGKSLSMVFYAGKLITSPEMKNPTIVVITDRNDLDNQLFDTFAASRQLLRQEPVQAESRAHLKELLKVAGGGIVFTTIQKFTPEDGAMVYEQLSERKNIVVIADEAHRTQYGFKARSIDIKDKDTHEKTGQRIAYGFAKYMRDALPNATYIGFTGTPIEGTDINTPQVFGHYVDVYDISQAVNDGATVRIYYESRLAKVNLDAEGRRLIEQFDEDLEEDESLSPSGRGGGEGQKAKAKWTKLEAIIGHPKRLKNVAKDIINHFEKRQRAFEGKAMIVTMSRRIAADLYREIIAIKPKWHDTDLDKGAIKVVMTSSSSDGPEISRHHTTKEQRRRLADRMKDPADPLKMVIVCDMWLTGFDAPCMKTLYIDKPMHGHTLMQAIARVNRVFKDIKGGLVVDYLGIASDLKKALSFYSDAGGKGNPAEGIDDAVRMVEEKLEVVRQMFQESSENQESLLAAQAEAYYKNSYAFDYRRFFKTDAKGKLSVILQAEEHILGIEDGKERFIREVYLLGQALSICISREEIRPYLEEIAFFQAVKAA